MSKYERDDAPRSKDKRSKQRGSPRNEEAVERSSRPVSARLRDSDPKRSPRSKNKGYTSDGYESQSSTRKPSSNRRQPNSPLQAKPEPSRRKDKNPESRETTPRRVQRMVDEPSSCRVAQPRRVIQYADEDDEPTRPPYRGVKSQGANSRMYSDSEDDRDIRQAPSGGKKVSQSRSRDYEEIQKTRPLREVKATGSFKSSAQPSRPASLVKSQSNSSIQSSSSAMAVRHARSDSRGMSPLIEVDSDNDHGFSGLFRGKKHHKDVHTEAHAEADPTATVAPAAAPEAKPSQKQTDAKSIASFFIRSWQSQNKTNKSNSAANISSKSSATDPRGLSSERLNTIGNYLGGADSDSDEDEQALKTALAHGTTNDILSKMSPTNRKQVMSLGRDEQSSRVRNQVLQELHGRSQLPSVELAQQAFTAVQTRAAQDKSADPSITSHMLAKSFRAAERFASSDDDFLESLNPETELLLVAYKNQVNKGPNVSERPGFFAPKEMKDLWAAWTKLGNMSADEAALRFIELLKQTFPAYDDRDIEEKAAIIIQSAWRMRTARNKFLMFNYLNYEAKKIQRLVRGFIIKCRLIKSAKSVTAKSAKKFARSLRDGVNIVKYRSTTAVPQNRLMWLDDRNGEPRICTGKDFEFLEFQTSNEAFKGIKVSDIAEIRAGTNSFLFKATKPPPAEEMALSLIATERTFELAMPEGDAEQTKAFIYSLNCYVDSVIGDQLCFERARLPSWMKRVPYLRKRFRSQDEHLVRRAKEMLVQGIEVVRYSDPKTPVGVARVIWLHVETARLYIASTKRSNPKPTEEGLMLDDISEIRPSLENNFGFVKTGMPEDKVFSIIGSEAVLYLAVPDGTDRLSVVKPLQALAKMLRGTREDYL